MRHAHTLVAAAAALALLAGCQSPTPLAATPRLSQAAQPAKKQAPAQILVKFKAGMRAAAIASFRAEFGTRNVGHIQGIDVYIEEVTSRRPVREVLEAMNADPMVEYAELNGEVGIVN